MPRRKQTSNFNETRIIPYAKRETRWSDGELLNLVAALQQYGFSETKKIAEVVKTKSENAVKFFLANEVQKVRGQLAKENGFRSRRKGSTWYQPDPEELNKWPAIRKWRRVVYNQLLPCVKKQEYSKILLEDLFETFYDEAEETNDPQVINIKAVYKYLLDCIRGTIPAELSPLDSGVVLLLLGQLKEMHRDLDFDAEIEFLTNFTRARPFAPIKVKDEFRERSMKRSEDLQNSIKIPKSSHNKGQAESSSCCEEEPILIPEEIFANLSKHRKVVQSFNPLNVPLLNLVKEQAYVQNKCTLSARKDFTK